MLTAGQLHRVLSHVVLPLMTQLFTTQGYFTATLEAERDAQRRFYEERNGKLTSSGSNGSGLGDGEDGTNHDMNSGNGRLKRFNFNASPEDEGQLIKSVSAACSRTRMRAVVLTSKTFLLHHSAIATGLDEDKFTQLWMSVLEVFRVAVEHSTRRKRSTNGSSDTANENSSKTGNGHQNSPVDIIPDDDDVTEHVPESVKNMLLVMCDSGLLTKAMPIRT